MSPKLRPLPYDTPESRALGINFWMTWGGMTRQQASKHITRLRHAALLRPMPGEVCGAHARTTGKPCQAPAGPNGRCKLHGGKSTGPRTLEGKARTVEALQTGLRLWRDNHRPDEQIESAVEVLY
ncbi:MAG: HGGxSTG domain-containing protein [Thiobacillus sp.]